MIGDVKTSIREKLIDAATELFYAEGLRAVSVDRVIERAGTTKVTFYRHFKSKDDLVVAHLERRAQQDAKNPPTLLDVVAPNKGQIRRAAHRSAEKQRHHPYVRPALEPNLGGSPRRERTRGARKMRLIERKCVRRVGRSSLSRQGVVTYHRCTAG